MGYFWLGTQQTGGRQTQGMPSKALLQPAALTKKWWAERAQKTHPCEVKISFWGHLPSKIKIFPGTSQKIIMSTSLLCCGGYRQYYLSLTGHLPCGREERPTCHSPCGAETQPASLFDSWRKWHVLHNGFEISRVFGSTSSNPSKINTFSLLRYQQVIGYRAVMSNLVCSETANFNLHPFLVHRIAREEQIKGEQIKFSCIWTQIAEKRTHS